MAKGLIPLVWSLILVVARQIYTRGWPKLSQTLWGKSSDGLAAFIWAPCAFTTTVDGVPVSVTVKTQYPFRDEIEVCIWAAKTVELPPGFAGAELDGSIGAGVCVSW